ncbi:MAG: hypothetical protein ACRELY_19640 [Polyangiaceae bacterium]
MKRYFRSEHVLCAVLPLLALACSAQRDSGYRGESLLTISGTVQSTAGEPAPSSANASLVWAQLHVNSQGSATGTPTLIGESVPVQGGFPESFTLNVYDPPPDSVLNPIDATNVPHIGLAFITATSSGASGAFDAHSVLGTVDDYLVVYLNEDVPPNVIQSIKMSTTQGYHLLKKDPPPSCGGVDYSCTGPIYAYEEVPQNTGVTIQLGDNPLLDLGGSQNSGPADAGSPSPGGQPPGPFPDAGP